MLILNFKKFLTLKALYKPTFQVKVKFYINFGAIFYVKNIQKKSIYRSKAIAAIENVERKILNPCNEPTTLHNVVPNGQKTNITVYKVIGAVTVQIRKSERAKFNIKKLRTVRIWELRKTANIVNKFPNVPNKITIK